MRLGAWTPCSQKSLQHSPLSFPQEISPFMLNDMIQLFLKEALAMFWYRTEKWPKPSSYQIFCFQLLYALTSDFYQTFQWGVGREQRWSLGSQRPQQKASVLKMLVQVVLAKGFSHRDSNNVGRQPKGRDRGKEKKVIWCIMRNWAFVGWVCFTLCSWAENHMLVCYLIFWHLELWTFALHSINMTSSINILCSYIQGVHLWPLSSSSRT